MVQSIFFCGVLERDQSHFGLLNDQDLFGLLTTHCGGKLSDALLVLAGWHKNTHGVVRIEVILLHQLQQLLLLLLLGSTTSPAWIEVQQHLITEGQGHQGPELVNISCEDAFRSTPTANTKYIVTSVELVMHGSQKLLQVTPCSTGFQKLEKANGEICCVCGERLKLFRNYGPIPREGAQGLCTPGGTCTNPLHKERMHHDGL
mmetsp:Transcript_28519/g.62071  ORF Transcript_28519/g.62071 Transcript_28519/m.62071 type:complete len:203 (+) Transcript_28519:1662-2270(+)